MDEVDESKILTIRKTRHKGISWSAPPLTTKTTNQRRKFRPRTNKEVKPPDEVTQLLEGFGSRQGGMLSEQQVGDGVEHLRMVCWEAVQPCNADCVAFDLCPHQLSPLQQTHTGGGLCRIQLKYMRNVMDLVMRNYGDQLTEPQLWVVGMHLVPLYKILCRLKVEEFTLRRVTTVNPKTLGVSISPILKEIRETMKCIRSVWEEVGIKIGDHSVRPNVGTHSDRLMKRFNGTPLPLTPPRSEETGTE